MSFPYIQTNPTLSVDALYGIKFQAILRAGCSNVIYANWSYDAVNHNTIFTNETSKTNPDLLTSSSFTQFSSNLFQPQKSNVVIRIGSSKLTVGEGS
jgi:hypothetical protein